MARIYQTGFEVGSLDMFDLVKSNGSMSTATTRGSWSTYSYSSTGATNQMTIGTTVSELYFGFGFYVTAVPGTQKLMVSFASPTATQQVSISFDSGSHISVTRGSGGGTVLGTSTTTLALSTWYYIEGHIIVSDTVGVFEVKQDGVQVINVTGADTRADAASANINRLFVLGDNASFLDDLYINDTTGSVNTGYSGDNRISAVSGIPTTDGSNTGMTLSTGTSHFAVVDERPPNTTDYAFGTGTTEVDTNNTPNTSGVGTVQGVMLWLYAAKSDAGAGNIATVLKSGATTDTGSDQALSTTYNYYRKMFNQDPNGPTNWTASAVDAMEIGAKSR